MRFRRRPWLVLCAILIAAHAAAADAAPRCEREAPAEHRITPVNGFAQNPAPRPIMTSRAQCAWGIGLAIRPSGTGTAFIIGDRREVMTNLHVADKGCHGNRHFIFSHGFNEGRALATIGATIVIEGDYCATLARGKYDYGGDWAIAVLDADPARIEGVPSGADIRPLQPRAGGGWLRDNGRYFLIGYGMSFRAGGQAYRSAPCRLGRLFGRDVVEHDCDASRRTSGAPILVEEASGRCLVAALHVGELEPVIGRPPYLDDINANIAVLARSFAPAVRAVARELAQGRTARQIAADLAAHPPGR